MVSNEKLLAELLALKTQVCRIADALQKQEDRKQYQAEYYKKKKAEKKKKKASNKLENRNKHVLEGTRDRRVPYKMWAAKLKQFYERGLSPYNYITWLAWAWNHDTFQIVPITKSGGYMHVFIGMSAQDGGRALRAKYSERDITGHVRVNTFKNKTQQDVFASALFWKWSFRVLGMVISEVDDQDWYKALGETWHRPMGVLQGPYGMYEVKHCGGSEPVYFNPDEPNLNLASKMYGLLRPTLEMGWSSTLKGFFMKTEPFIAD